MVRTGALFLAFLFVVSGCSLLSPYIHISEINDKPHKYQDKRVLIRGEVTETFSVPFVQKGAYQVDDGTGRIWVISPESTPFRGEAVTVKGEVKTSFTIFDRSFGTVIVEEGEE